MPILISAYIRPDQGSPVVPPAPNAPPPPPPISTADLAPVLTTQRPYQFAGYHLAHDGDENIIYTTTPTAWLTQPRNWSRRAVNVVLYDLRSY